MNQRKFKTGFLFVLLLLATACVSGSKPVAPVSLTIVYTGSLDGELEPCGCSEGGNKGGLKRRASKIDELRQQEPNLIFLSSGGLLVSDMPQDKLKSEYILKGMQQMSYDAVGIQWQDLAYGGAFLTQHDINWVASNYAEKGLSPFKIINRPGVQLGFYQWLDPDVNPVVEMSGDEVKKQTAAELLEAMRKARLRGQLNILSTTLTLDKASSLFDLSVVDVLIIKAKYEKYGEPQMSGSTLVLQPGSRGMRMGKAVVSVQNGELNLQQHEVIPLPSAVVDAPRMLSWYDEYNAKVKQAYQQRVELRKKLMSGESPYAGEKVCKKCHQVQHSVWFDTRHAQAFYSLQDAGKSFDPDCIGCHTVGFDRPGGFVDSQMTAALQHVQCENCHGAAKAHADAGGMSKTENNNWKPQQMCSQCHVQKHSPDFDFAKYWPKIKH